MRKSSILGAPALGASVALVISTPAQTPAGTSGGDWPSYAGDLRSQHYAPLVGTRPEYKLEGTPLVVKGAAYTTAGSTSSSRSAEGTILASM
jgi:quinoprotein glucose dehydrogenase